MDLICETQYFCIAFSFDFYPYTVSLNYQSSLLHTREEVAVVLLGPVTNIIVLSLLVMACWLTQKTIGNFPDLFCKLIMVYAILTFLDPILIAIVDAPLGVRIYFKINLQFPTHLHLRNIMSIALLMHIQWQV